MRQGLSEELIMQMCSIVKAHLDNQSYRFILFGTRATGKAQERSDIDLGIEANNPIPSE